MATSAVSAAESPLKQVNQAGAPKRSKLDTCWHDLTHQPTLFTATDLESTTKVPPPKRYFSEFFCLNPNRETEESALAALSNEDLLGPCKNNVSLLFTHAVRTLKEAKSDDTCRSHALETLFPLLRNVLEREYADQSYDVINILAGNLDRSDQVFTDLVSAIDMTLQDSKSPTLLRHRTLQLALLIVATVGQGSLVAYFLRRDLFSTLVAFIADDETKPFAFEATLLLGLLANYRKCEARNPYGVRIEDFVEEGVMERMIDVVTTVCARARDSYVAVSDDAPPTFVGSLTMFVRSMRLTELLSGGFYLPPPPSPSAPATKTTETPPAALDAEEPTRLTAEEKGKGRAIQDPDEEKPAGEREKPAADAAPQEAAEKGTSDPRPEASSSSALVDELAHAPSRPTSKLERVTSSGSSTASRPTLSRNNSGRPPRPEDKPYAALPPAMIVLLLPFYELLDANKTFCSLVYNDRSAGASPTLPVELVSFTSYLVSHAALSQRARVYSRLAFSVLMILVEEGEGKLTRPRPGGEDIRLCRQRAPQLPAKDASRSIPISALIDAIVLFLRHNLRKKLEVETYTLALRLLQRSFQQLKNEHVKLDRDWVTIWRSLLSLASFVVSHRADLRHLGESLDALISQLFVTLAYAAYWSEQLLPDAATQARLYYELLHADETLSALSDLLGVSSISPPNTLSTSGSANGANTPTKASTSTCPYLSRRETANQSGFLSLHSTLSSSSPTGIRPGLGGNGTSKESARFVATECIANLRSTITFFSGHIAAHKEAKRAKNAASWWPRRARSASTATQTASQDASTATTSRSEDEDHLEPDEILSVVEAHLGAVELIESAAMGDLPRYASELDLSAGSGEERFWKEVVDVACRDTIQLLQDEPPVLPFV